MDYGVVKSLHLIFVVSWFAGLFYIVRLFIYHVEAQSKPEVERKILQTQYKLMQWRLWYIISWPAMILTVLFGTWMLFLNPALIQMDFMLVKLGFVFILVVYHMVCHLIFFNLQKDVIKYTSGKLRIFNEIATLLLVIIVFIIVMKSSMNAFTATLGFIATAVVLMLGIKIYKRFRNDKLST